MNRWQQTVTPAGRQAARADRWSRSLCSRCWRGWSLRRVLSRGSPPSSSRRRPDFVTILFRTAWRRSKRWVLNTALAWTAPRTAAASLPRISPDTGSSSSFPRRETSLTRTRRLRLRALPAQAGSWASVLQRHRVSLGLVRPAGRRLFRRPPAHPAGGGSYRGSGSSLDERSPGNLAANRRMVQLSQQSAGGRAVLATLDEATYSGGKMGGDHP